MKYVWLESGDAVHQIDEADSAVCARVYDTKKAVLRFWKERLGDIEFLTNRPNRMAIVWHKYNGENVLHVAYKRAVFTYEKKGKKK